MKKAELVFLPIPAMGHIVAAVEVSKLLVQRDDRLSISVLVMKPALESSASKVIESLAASTLPDRLRVINLPSVEPRVSNAIGHSKVTSLVEFQKPNVKDFVSNLKTQSELSPDSPRFVGFVFDSFATGMIDLASEFGVPWYAFSASGAAFVGCILYLQALHDEQKVDLTEFKNSDTELIIPSLVNPLPAKLLPAMVFGKEPLSFFLDNVRRVREAKGILVNTFLELESHAVGSLSNAKTPRLYPVGPIVKRKGDGHDVGSDQVNGYRDIMGWLDDQPQSSVVFLCFGSWGSFSAEQVKEIAYALEHSGHRFLWSLRKPSSNNRKESPCDYNDFREILPDGFLNRTAKIGKVIGWAPQVEILVHPAAGGFVSHCGWNSTLESICSGVPMATWPIYSEQQFNAFQIVIDLGLGVEIKMDYTREFKGVVSANDIMKGIRSLMKQDSEVRKKVTEMGEISKKTSMDGGSSYASLGLLIEDIMMDNKA